ncbi:MAG: metal-dependent transcriptional regulator [Actinomycetota bacterium]|jgi:DtxR family Mn-dependent transcriptional regulator|nr:metal-dependent transcriptional regulator [Euzebyaceae bacterium]MDQ3452691.1 metal-dependent transcriptional regulator [Actinomycetota bacterium]
MTTPLIDATEMYLRTVWELEEEGITPIRARLVDRLGLSAPAVSETVARLEHEGLVHVADNRTLELSDYGRELAIGVMRKHRLAELLLTEVIGLEWEEVHNEACRWEHVISDAVEQRLVDLLGSPTACPHGNPIPGLSPAEDQIDPNLLPMMQAAKSGGRARVTRISEKLQGDVGVMRFLREHGLRPGVTAGLRVDGGMVLAEVDGRAVAVPDEAAEHVYVLPSV